MVDGGDGLVNLIITPPRVTGMACKNKSLVEFLNNTFIYEIQNQRSEYNCSFLKNSASTSKEKSKY